MGQIMVVFYNLPFAWRHGSLSYVPTRCNWSCRSGVDGVLSPPSFLSISAFFFAYLLHLSPSHSFTCLTLLHCLPFHSVSVQPTEQQYGTRFGEQTSVYQSVQLRDHLQRANAVTLLSAKLNLRGHVSSPGHPVQH